MSQSVYVVTLYGIGFDRLAARGAVSRCRFGGSAAAAALTRYPNPRGPNPSP